MNCQSLQNRVLALPDPRQLPEQLRLHLETCGGCRAWWKQAVRLEQLLTRLPAPPAPTEKKNAFLDELTAAGPVIKSIPAVPRSSVRSLFSRIGRIPAAKTLAGLAAAILIAVAGWLMTRPGPNNTIVAKEAPRDPFLEIIVKRDLDLARAKSPEQRLEALGGLADDLSAQARTLSKIATPEDLRDLSGMFQKVVGDGIVQQVRAMNADTLSATRKQELYRKLTHQLAEAGRQADESAKESPPHALPALKQISDTARKGQAELQTILGAKS
ncbi:MAG TPA: hypothetical protein VN641_09370 [Urbifossiella sp.]|nr:hypothetical protein [Urbifossiella sp.]